MTHSGRFHGGLVFLGNQDGVLDRFVRIASATLEDYGHRIERQSTVSARQVRVTSSSFVILLNLEPIQDAPAQQAQPGRIFDRRRAPRRKSATEKKVMRLSITLAPANFDKSQDEESELLLVVMLYRMVEAYGADYVEWLSPDTSLSVDQFLAAFTDVSPRRVIGRQEIVGAENASSSQIDETKSKHSHRASRVSDEKPVSKAVVPVKLTEEQSLALVFRTDSRPDDWDGLQDPARDSDVRRLATWGMTGMVFFLSAPVALSMAAVNLARGEDFRLNTQVLSLTGVIVVAQNSGALASVMSSLPL